MACQLQPECNFLHGVFKCKLPIGVVDVEVKVTSMQGTYLYKRDRTTQVTKCVLWTNNIHPHPNIIKKMKTFLEVENKMGMTIQTSMQNSQFRPRLLQTNPNICRSDNMERRKTIMPKRKFKPATPKITATNPPLFQAPPKPNNDNPPMAREDTPWPGASKMLGDLFKERDWPLPKGYLAMQNKKENIDITSLKEESKITDNSKNDKCGWGPNCPLCKAQEKKEENFQQRPLPNPQTLKQAKTKSQQLWEAEMERLNDKYNLDCFSDSELDSESDEGEEYRYEHG